MATPETFVGIDVGKHWLDAACAGDPHTQRFANTPEGRRELLGWVLPLQPHLVALEPTGGYERPVIDDLMASGLPVARVNPSQVRAFARGRGRRAKNDRLDAQVLARHAQLAQPRPLAPAEADRDELAALTQRRRQVQETLTAETHRLPQAHASVRADVAASIAACRAQVADLDQRIAALIEASPALQADNRLLQSVPGVGPVVSATLLAELPELGAGEPKRLAALAGLAPMDDDSGQRSRPRTICGGRAEVRRALYLAALVGSRCNPALRVFYTRLLANGKAKKVALVAAARKLLGVLHAILRDREPWRDNTRA